MMRYRFLAGCALMVMGLLLYANVGYAQLYGRTAKDLASVQTARSETENILIILDASDSMNEVMDGKPKIQLAKDVVLNTIRSMPPHINVGLRVYGHRLGSSNGFSFQGPFGGFVTGGDICRQTQLLTPLGINNRASIASQLLNVQAVGKTPITYTLDEAVTNDFRGRVGKKTIILVSDGRETCSYNPCDLAVDMVRAGVDIKINTIGFGTRDKIANDQLRCIALSSKGKFYNANTAAQLAKSLKESTQVETSVQAKIHTGP